jgi:PilZ domain-containing protein
VKQENGNGRLSSTSSNHKITVQQVEKRSHFRIAVSIRGEMVELSTGAHVIGMASDLGFGGCFVETKHPFPAGTKVGVRLSWEGSTFRCRGLVTHADGAHGMGLVFTEADPSETVSVLDWLTSVGLARHKIGSFSH